VRNNLDFVDSQLTESGAVMDAKFPEQQAGLNYLTEGGQETEIMYKYGFDLPHFAMFPLLDNPTAVAELRGMYGGYLDTAARHGFGVVIGGLDYRASPDWGNLLGYSGEALADMQLRAIEFLRDVAEPYRGQVPALLYAGVVGPRGDAYELNKTITAAEAEDYHSVQLATLVRAGVDLVEAMTFNSVPEAIGLSQAASRAGLPLTVSFTLDNSTGRLASGPTVKEAIETIDSQAGANKPACYGINCSHPLEFMPAIEPGDWFQRVRILRPNAAMMDKISLCTLGHLESGDPAALGELMGDLARQHPHIDVWGGCCGTWDVHLEAIARNVSVARSTG
jgi:S-methylmethionine-dependent homocysteine/selenocysteine methylase